MSKPDSIKAFAVIDLEGSGLKLKDARKSDYESFDHLPHRPGVDHACILEVGVVILDAETLHQIERQSWLVLPPGVTSPEAFEEWAKALQANEPFVYDMHTKNGLLEELRLLAGSKNKPADPLEWTSNQVTAFLRKHSDVPEPYHPGNSDVMFVGNSIANYDVPMLRRWMPEVTKALSYRTLDVSVLRTFFKKIAKIEMPKVVDDLISGSVEGKEETHRAIDDCLHCAEALRGLTTYARNLGMAAELWNDPRTQKAALSALRSDELQARVAHLEMLIKYGSRRAIKNERRLIEAYDGRNATTPEQSWPEDDNKGLFENSKIGGIFRKEIGSEEGDFDPLDPITGHYIGRNGTGNGNGR